MKHWPFFFLILLASCDTSNKQKIIFKEQTIAVTNLKTLAFGSCNKMVMPMEIWESIAAQNADIFCWTGDIIYPDGPWRVNHDIDRIENHYAAMQQNEFYKLVSDHTPIIGIYDDHDFGSKNGGKEYIHKSETQKLLLDFLGEPLQSVRRKQEGIYTSYRFTSDNHIVSIILLDTRYGYVWEGDQPHAMDAAQWKWLHQTLENDTVSTVTIIASGYAVIPTGYGEEGWYETSDRQKLLQLLEADDCKNFIFLTGDRHFGEISVLNNNENKNFVEVLSSGLTHYAENTNPAEKNSYRVGDKFIDRNFGLLSFHLNDSNAYVNCMIKNVTGETVRSHKLMIK